MTDRRHGLAAAGDPRWRRGQGRWPPTSDIHTVGELVRHYPRRYVERGQLTDIAGLQRGEYATLVARVASKTIEQMRQRHGQMMQVTLRDGHGGRLDATFFNPHRLRGIIEAGHAGPVRRQGRRVPGKPQLTHPQFEPLPDGDDIRPFLAIYPATAKLPSWKIGNCVRQVLDVLDDPTDPLPAALRKAEGLAELGRALRRIHVPETEADHHAARNRLVWDEAMGVQLALALRRAGRRLPAGAGLPAEAGRAAGRVRRPAPVPAHRGPGRGGRRDRRRSGRGAPDEPPGAGRGRRRQDGGGAAGDAAGDRLRPAGRAARADRGARRPARPLVARAARAARDGRRARRGRPGHQRHPAHRLAGRGGPPPGAAGRRSPARPASSSARTR